MSDKIINKQQQKKWEKSMPVYKGRVSQPGFSAPWGPWSGSLTATSRSFY